MAFYYCKYNSFFCQIHPTSVYKYQFYAFKKKKQNQLESKRGVIAIVENTTCSKFNLLLFM